MFPAARTVEVTAVSYMLLSSVLVATRSAKLSAIAPENFYQWPDHTIIDASALSKSNQPDNGGGNGNSDENGRQPGKFNSVVHIYGTRTSNDEPVAIDVMHEKSSDQAWTEEQDGGERPSVAHTAGISAQEPDYYSGWVEYSGYEAFGNITHMSTTFTVPPAPPHYNILTTTFLFAGLEENNKHDVPDILQPVLQYGHSGCGGGKHWSAASYYVVGITAHCGKMLRVETGDVIEANMTYSKQSDLWTMATTVLSHFHMNTARWDGEAGSQQGNLPAETDTVHAEVSTLQVRIGHAYHWAIVTLEAIRVYACTAYPGGTGTRFSNISVDVNNEPVRSPQWQKTVHYTECGQGVDIVDSQTAVLHYNASTVDRDAALHGTQ